MVEVDARTAPDETLLRFHELELACAPDLAPGEPARSAQETIGYHRFQPTTNISCYWEADGGYAALYVHGPTSAFVRILVHPERRRAGIGTAFLERVLARCAELEVRALHGQHGSPPGAAFAAHAGAVETQRVVTSVLDLAEARLEASPLPSGWRLETWIGRVPDEHLDAYVVARTAMDDAPAPEAMDFPAYDAEHVRAAEASLLERDREMRLTVAIRDDGVVGSFTELRVSRGSRSGFTDDSGTAAEHRGQGLARAVKAESLRRLRADHPEVEVVTTSNAEVNAAMRHINESVGFRPVVTLTLSTLELPTTTTP